MNIDDSISAFLANGFELLYEAYQTDDLDGRGDICKIAVAAKKMTQELELLSNLSCCKYNYIDRRSSSCYDSERQENLGYIMKKAIDCDSELAMRRCFEFGFDQNLENKEKKIYEFTGTNASLFVDALCRSVVATKLFVDNGADVEKKVEYTDYECSNALALVVLYNRGGFSQNGEEIMDFLVQKGVKSDCFVKIPSGDTFPIVPFIATMGYSDYDDADHLLCLIDKLTAKNKNIINKKIPKSGATALHMAAYARNLEVMVGLLDRDADPLIKMNDGRTPMDLLFDKDGNYYDVDYRKHKKGDNHEDRVLMEERLSKVKEAYNRNRERAKNKVYLNQKDNTKEM